MERILWHGVDGAFVAGDDGRSRYILYPEPCGPVRESPEAIAFRKRDIGEEGWDHVTNIDPNHRGNYGSSSEEVIRGLRETYGPENVRETHNACDSNGIKIPGYHALYVRKQALDTARELSPDRAFETH